MTMRKKSPRKGQTKKLRQPRTTKKKRRMAKAKMLKTKKAPRRRPKAVGLLEVQSVRLAV